MDAGLSGVEFEALGRIASKIAQKGWENAFLTQKDAFLPIFDGFYPVLLSQDRQAASERLIAFSGL